MMAALVPGKGFQLKLTRFAAGQPQEDPGAVADGGRFALASVSYRFSDRAVFPAQIHDVKAAIRWLRAHQDEYGYDASRIGVCGTSAGGQLAVLLGTSGGVKELEGTVGEHLQQSSRVQAIVDWYGPADFLLRSKTQPKHNEPKFGTPGFSKGGGTPEGPPT